jgi:hypothetical protein
VSLVEGGCTGGSGCRAPCRGFCALKRSFDPLHVCCHVGLRDRIVIEHHLRSVEQVLMAFVAFLRVVELHLPAIVPRLYLVQLDCRVAQARLLRGVIWIAGGLCLHSAHPRFCDLGLLAVSERLLTVSDALAEISEHLVLIEPSLLAQLMVVV